MLLGYRSKAKWMFQTLDREKQAYLERAEQESNAFARALLAYLAENTAADGVEFFAELACDKNFLRENSRQLDGNHRRRYFVLMGMYHSLRLCREAPVELSLLRSALRRGYQWTEVEARVFDALCGVTPDWQFCRAFTAVFRAYVLELPTGDPQANAMFAGLLEYSHTYFLGEFTKFMTLERRLELAKEEKNGHEMDSCPGRSHYHPGAGPAGGSGGRQRQDRCAG